MKTVAKQKNKWLKMLVVRSTANGKWGYAPAHDSISETLLRNDYSAMYDTAADAMFDAARLWGATYGIMDFVILD